jgi:preprotein translocase subunit SecF
MVNFLKYRKATALSSLCLMLAFVGVAMYRQQTRGSVYTYSVDFTGGTQILLGFEQEVNGTQIKQIIADNGWPSVSTREFGKHEVLVRVKEFEDDMVGLGERMKDVVQDAMPDNNVQILQTESVGAGVGADLRGKSLYAMGVALILMLLYIAMRFWSFAFATGAILALVHDAIVMLAIFLFLDREISINFIAAILTVLGYSINDTIVIFSQIREFMKKRKGVPLEEIVNDSLNYTLRRTMLTSISTGLPVLVMLIFGGEALQDFSLALLIGIVFGTYSSVYIASPIMMLLQPKEDHHSHAQPSYVKSFGK